MDRPRDAAARHHVRMRSSPLPETFRDRAFSTSEALAGGIRHGRLRGADLERPFRGVRHATAADIAPHLSCLERMPEHEFFSHATAATIHGLRLPQRLADDPAVDIGVFPPDRLPRAAGIRGHTVRRRHATLQVRDGFRVVSALDAWRELAPMLSVDELIIAGDGLVRRVNPAATLDDLVTAVRDSRGMHGSKRLVAALPQIRCRTDSERETRVRLRIVRSGLPEPVANHPILDAHGRFLGFADLAYPEYRIVIEYDGDQHREESQYFTDVDRLDAFMAQSWRVIRINRRHGATASGDPVVDRVRQALLAAGWSPTRDTPGV